MCGEMKDKTAVRVAKALEDHILGAHGEVPTIVQSDNGGEFRNHDFAELAVRRGFKQVFSSSYSPQSNGCIERFNHTLKQLIRHHFVTSGTKRWVDVLPDLLENYNSATHSSTKFAPGELVAAWEQGDDVILARSRANLVKRAKKSLGSEPDVAIKVGDHVRTLVSRRKKPMKTGDTKLRRPVWSESVHAVERVSSPTNGLSLPRYTLEGSTERWYANELQRVELEKLVPHRRRSINRARGFSKRVVIPVPALMERKTGARTTRRPVRFQDGASSGSSESDGEEGDLGGGSDDSFRDDDDDDDDNVFGDDGAFWDDDDDDLDDDSDVDDDDDVNAVDEQLQYTRRGRVIRLPLRFVDQDE
jgi:hypothetical protein